VGKQFGKRLTVGLGTKTPATLRRWRFSRFAEALNGWRAAPGRLRLALGRRFSLCAGLPLVSAFASPATSASAGTPSGGTSVSAGCAAPGPGAGPAFRDETPQVDRISHKLIAYLARDWYPRAHGLGHRRGARVCGRFSCGGDIDRAPAKGAEGAARPTLSHPVKGARASLLLQV
jgi:hypothetical protein